MFSTTEWSHCRISYSSITLNHNTQLRFVCDREGLHLSFWLLADGKCKSVFCSLCLVPTNTLTTSGLRRRNSCKLAGVDPKCVCVVLWLLSVSWQQLPSGRLHWQCRRVDWILCHLSRTTLEAWRQATQDCSTHKSTYQTMGILSRCHCDILGALETGDK